MGHQKKLASPLATCIISEHISREYLIWPQLKSTVVHITPPMGVTCSWARVCMTYYACSIEEPQYCIVPCSARVSMTTTLVEELQNCIVPHSARTWWSSCYKTAIATLSQDLMLVLLKKYKTTLCHTRPGSDAVPVKELQNHIVPRLARIWWWSCWRTTKPHCATLGQGLHGIMLLQLAHKTTLCQSCQQFVVWSQAGFGWLQITTLVTTIRQDAGSLGVWLASAVFVIAIGLATCKLRFASGLSH